MTLTLNKPSYAPWFINHPDYCTLKYHTTARIAGLGVEMIDILNTHEPSQCDAWARTRVSDASHLGVILTANNDDGYGSEGTQENIT